MMIRRAAFAALLLAATGCSDDYAPLSPAPSDDITLTAPQATVVLARVRSFVTQDAALATLADTLHHAIQSGTVVKRVALTTDIGAGPFYAASLHLPRLGATESSALFYVVAFDDPSNPTTFVILRGFGSGDLPPASVAGSAASADLSAYLFTVSGEVVTMGRALAGSISLTSSATPQPCASYDGPGICIRGAMDASFTFSTTLVGQRAASGSIAGIPGIRLGS